MKTINQTPNIQKTNTSEAPRSELNPIHWEIVVAGFRVVPSIHKKPGGAGLESVIELYSEEQTTVGILRFYRNAKVLPVNNFLMGCVHGHFQEHLSQNYVDILTSFEDVRLIYRGKTAVGGRTYLQPSEKVLRNSTTDAADA